MADLPSLWVLDQPADRREQIADLELRSLRLARKVSSVIHDATSEAMERFVKTLPDQSLIASGDYSAFDAIYQTWLITGDETLLPLIEQTYGLGAQSAVVPIVQRFTIPTNYAIDLDMIFPQNAAAYVAIRENLIKDAGNVIFADVKQRVADAVAKGSSPDVLARDLREIIDLSTARIETIARTELLTAHSVGQWETMTDLAEFGPKEKAWDSTIDQRTRTSHAAMQRDRLIPVQQPFQVGATTLMYPRAPGGAAAEVINCRCVMLEYYEGDKRPDGSIIR